MRTGLYRPVARAQRGTPGRRGERWFRGPEGRSEAEAEQGRASTVRKCDAVGNGPAPATDRHAVPCLPIHLPTYLPAMCPRPQLISPPPPTSPTYLPHLPPPPTSPIYLPPPPGFKPFLPRMAAYIPIPPLPAFRPPPGTPSVSLPKALPGSLAPRSYLPHLGQYLSHPSRYGQHVSDPDLPPLPISPLTSHPTPSPSVLPAFSGFSQNVM